MRGTAFKALCVHLCVCAYVCLSYEWLIQIKLWDSSWDNSFTAWAILFLYSYHYQKEGKLQSSFIQLQRKRINPTLSSNNSLCIISLCDKHGEEHALGLILLEISWLTMASVAWLMQIKLNKPLLFPLLLVVRLQGQTLFMSVRDPCISREIHLLMQGCAALAIDALAIDAQEHCCTPHHHQL